MEQTREIPRNEWRSFFDAFSRQHEGWLATLEIFSSDMGAQEPVQDLPLEGVTVSVGADTDEEISISLGKTAAEHVTHNIEEPTHVWIEETAEGANAALEVESKDQTKTLLRFRAAVRPEFVDGVVLE
jgi:Family of unknown function (DUF5335)